MKLLNTILVLCMTVPVMAGWSVETSPVTVHLNGVYALNTDDVWIAGNTGTILHYDGTDWTTADTPTDKNLNAIQMIDNDEGWAVGSEGTILHSTGGIWESITGYSEQVTFQDVVAFAPGNVYVIGYSLLDGGMVLNWNGTDFSTVHATSSNLIDMAATGPDEIWVVGGNDYRVYYNGTVWTEDTVSLADPIKLFSVSFDTDGMPVILGTRMPGWDKEIIYGRTATGEWTTLYNNWGPSLMNINIYQTRGYAMGKNGKMLELSIYGWAALPEMVTNQLNTVYLLDMSRGWAVGDSGLILRYKSPAIDMLTGINPVTGGDLFEVAANIQNPGASRELQVLMLLDAYGTFFFWPAWSSDVSFETRVLPENTDQEEQLFSFTWPSGAGTGTATFWGALMDGSELLAYDRETFNWN